MNVAITGSTGFIGSALVRALQAQGHGVVRVVRSGSSGAGRARWDPERGTIDSAALQGVDAVVNLASQNVGSWRWTRAQKARILESRVRSTTLLAETLANLTPMPRVLLSASAMGYYGDRGDEVLTEEAGPGEGFLAMVCRKWEAATSPAEQAGIRVCYARSGLPLGREGGLLKRLLLPFRLGVGGKLAGGGFWMSWISITDEVDAMIHLLQDEGARGPFNLAAPNAVRNDEFTRVLGRVLHRPAVIPIPKWLIAIPYGRELTDEFLSSIHVVPARLNERGYRFRSTDLEEALRAELGR